MDRKVYLTNWEEIAAPIKVEVTWCCEFCDRTRITNTQKRRTERTEPTSAIPPADISQRQIPGLPTKFEALTHQSKHAMFFECKSQKVKGQGLAGGPLKSYGG